MPKCVWLTRDCHLHSSGWVSFILPGLWRGGLSHLDAFQRKGAPLVRREELWVRYAGSSDFWLPVRPHQCTAAPRQTLVLAFQIYQSCWSPRKISHTGFSQIPVIFNLKLILEIFHTILRRVPNQPKISFHLNQSFQITFCHTLITMWQLYISK